MQANLLLAAGIVLFVFLAWVSTGGPARALIAPSEPAEYSSVPAQSWSSGMARDDARDERRELERIQAEVVDLQRSAVSASRFGTPSPYRGQVSLSLGTGPRSTRAQEEYLSLSVSARAEGPISISGWRIVSAATGRSMTVPEGVATPRSARVNAKARIELEPGARAYLTTGASPVGMSFRENLCTGYLDQFQDFTPTLPHACPSARDDLDRFYFGSDRTLDACRAYLRTVPRCEVPRNAPGNIGSECRAFIDTRLDYNGCVDSHLGDKGFFSKDWRIYFERNDEFLTKDHDTVKLLDANGLTVDLVSY